MTELSATTIPVEVAYALPERQALLKVDVSDGATVKQAIEASGILNLFPDIDLEKNKVGVFSKVCKLDRVLQAGDRVEIYRPLLIDPKQRRRDKAKAAKQ